MTISEFILGKKLLFVLY